MELFLKAKTEEGLSLEEIRGALLQSLEGRTLKNVLIIPPDFTRFHSNAGYITNVYYHTLTEMGCEVDILPALGTHVPVTEEEAAAMFGDVPFEKFIPHNWRTDVMKLGEVPAEYLEKITEGLWHDSVSVEINRLVMDEKYDLIISEHFLRYSLRAPRSVRYWRTTPQWRPPARWYPAPDSESHRKVP